MSEINFFNVAQRSSIERKEIVNKKAYIDMPESYKSFGYDYFDNPNIGVGYGGYRYDGRYEKSISNMIQYYNLNSNSKVLEIGCAKGFILYEFFKKNIDVYGIDVSNYAKENSILEISEKIIIQNIENGIPFENNYFDLVISKEVFPHINEKKIDFVIEETKRVSKNNIFLEIQCCSSKEDFKDFKKWDNTHQIIKTEKQWLELFSKNTLVCDYHFKQLI